MRTAAAFGLLLLTVVLGFLAGALLLFGGTGGVLPAAGALVLAIACGVLAFRASDPSR